MDIMQQNYTRVIIKKETVKSNGQSIKEPVDFIGFQFSSGHLSASKVECRI